MPLAAEKSRVLRFGLFEVDLREAELRKSGVRIKLQDQPFQILKTLLERPGETVTREELRQRLWPADTFVDFDHSLNSSIKKLREALGDDSENPRFIETLHRRGYRFIAPVDGPNGSAAEQTRQTSSRPTATAHEKRPTKWMKWAASVIVIVAVAFSGLWLRPQLPPPRVIASQELTNDGLPKDSLVADGNQIYFAEYPRGRIVIAQVSSRGGETATINTPLANPAVDGISEDRSELLVNSTDGSVWAQPLPTGSPRRLGNINAYYAIWNHNGKLVFAIGNDLYTAEHDGSNPRKLATLPGSIGEISCSPDGMRYRFTVNSPSNHTSTIWEMHADGSNPHPLLPGWSTPSGECCGRWSSDGKYYVFQSNRRGATQLWIIRERSEWWRRASHAPIQLTVGPLQLSNPTLSSDGKKLFAVGTRRRAQLVRYDAKSAEFLPYLGGISAGDADFTRDGQWVTYVSYPDNTLWRSRLDGSERLQLTQPPLYPLVPHWSPDGEAIAFSGSVPGKPWKIFLVPRNGGNLQSITGDEQHELDPSWSPDGATLAFGRSALANDESSRVALLNLKTRQISELPNSQGICCPRWSPDGRYIVAVSSAPHQDHLLLFDFKNDEWRELKTNLNVISFAYMSWSHDSKYVYFGLNWGREDEYFRIRISDSKLERPVNLAKLQQFPDVAGPAESWTGLDPEDKPLFVRDISTQEIYSLDLEFP